MNVVGFSKFSCDFWYSLDVDIKYLFGPSPRVLIFQRIGNIYKIVIAYVVMTNLLCGFLLLLM